MAANFDPDAYLAKYGDQSSEFDPDAYLAKYSQPSKLESFGRGAVQGATLGFADEVAAANKASPLTGLPMSGGFIGAPTKAMAMETEAMPQEYQRQLGTQRSEYETARAANPKTYFGGEIAGSLAVPTTGVAQAVGVGALSGLGMSEGDAVNQGLGTTLGAAAGGVGGLIGKGIGMGVKGLSGMAERQATRASKMTPSMLQMLEKKGISQEEAGRFLLDEGIVGTFTGPDEMAVLLDQASQKYGQKIGDVIKKAEESGAGKVPLRGVAEDVTSKYEPMKSSMLSSLRDDYSKIMQELQPITDGAISGEHFPTITEAQKLKTQLGQSINWNSADPRKDIYRALSSKIDEAIDKVSQSAGDLKGARRGYQITKELERPIDYGAAKEAMHPEIGIKPMMAGGLGAHATGSSLMGGITGTAAEFTRRYGRQVSATALDSMAKNLEKLPAKYRQAFSAAAQRGQKSMAVTDYLLSQTDPEYQALKKQFEQEYSE